MIDLVVNVTENWGIGQENTLLVTISADLKRFRQLTTGKTVVLGRKTLQTFPGGKPLKNRRNLVLSGNPSLYIDGAEVVHSLSQLHDAVKNEKYVSVIGGASIYEMLLPYCEKAYVTKTFTTVPADRFFPNLDDLPNWHIESESEVMEENGIRFQYVDYVNDSPKWL